ncbi:hypothetical protein EDD16DRAFT_1522564 [Pisolithus croceorrhizus]|nr:hypothetical protein EDD16DRAFT_1522564 [Pisolithus croceorrhizus]
MKNHVECTSRPTWKDNPSSTLPAILSSQQLNQLKGVRETNDHSSAPRTFHQSRNQSQMKCNHGNLPEPTRPLCWPDANAPSPPPKKIQKNKPTKRHDVPSTFVHDTMQITCLNSSSAEFISTIKIVDIVPISPRKPSRPYSPSPTDDGSLSSESRSGATHHPSMEGTASVDQTVNIPTLPGGGSLDQMAAMCNALIPAPPGTAAAPHMDRMEALHRATIPTLPADSPAPRMDRLAAIIVAMHNVAIPLPPVVSTALPSQPPPINNLERMRMAAIPVPPSTVPAPNMDQLERMCNATIPHPPSSPINNLERMRMAAIPIPPSVVPAPNMDRLERMCNAAIPHPPSLSMEMMDAQPQPSSNIGYPQQSTSTEVANSQRQPCTITGEDINQGEEPDRSHTLDFGTPDHRADMRPALKCCGRHHAGDMPTPDEHQALEQAGLATSDADDNFLRVLHMFKLWHGAGFPSSNIPYDTDLDGHIMRAMCQISANICQLVRSRVQHVEAGQYTVDMIDLLEVSWHPHVGYSLEPYTGGPPYPSQQSAIEMAIVYLGCHIECMVIHLLGMPRPSNWPAEWYGNLCLDMISHFIPNWMPRSPNKYAGFVFPWWVDRSPQYHADFQQIRGARIFPIAHEYFQHTWPLQQLSMGDQIDEWMEEKVSAYMITARSAAGWTYGVKYIMEFRLTDVRFAACIIWKTYLYLPAAVHPPPVGSEPPSQKHTYKGGSLCNTPGWKFRG